MASISIRRGRLAPSARKKPAGAYGASDTNWRMGIDAPSFGTTYNESCSRVREAKHEPRKKHNKNRSDEVFDGSNSPPPSDPRFTTVNRIELTKSVLTEGFSIGRPMEGFDRLTANRTNYSLGDVARHFSTTTAELQMKHPKDQPAVIQPAIGGFTLPDGSYRLDAFARDSSRRGGGGGAGALGVRFDIINGTRDDAARGKVAMRTGPRVTLNNVEKRVLHPTDGWGDMQDGCYIDVVTGQERVKPIAPERGAEGRLRSNWVIGRTRPW